MRQRVIDADFIKLVQLPPSLDCNEWLATHSEYIVSLEAANNVTVTGTRERERERERERARDQSDLLIFQDTDLRPEFSSLAIRP